MQVEGPLEHDTTVGLLPQNGTKPAAPSCSVKNEEESTPTFTAATIEALQYEVLRANEALILAELALRTEATSEHTQRLAAAWAASDVAEAALLGVPKSLRTATLFGLHAEPVGVPPV